MGYVGVTVVHFIVHASLYMSVTGSVKPQDDRLIVCLVHLSAARLILADITLCQCTPVGCYNTTFSHECAEH